MLKLDALAEASTQDGKDPEINKLATTYSTRDYQMTIEPLLEALVLSPEFTTLLEDRLTTAKEVTAEEIQMVLDTDTFHGIVQTILKSQKYMVLEKSADSKEEAEASGLLIPRRRKIVAAAEKSA